MKFNINLASLVLLATSVECLGLKIRYDNYKVYRFTPKNEEDFQLLSDLRSHGVDVLYWQKPNHIKKHFDIMFPPHSQGDTFQLLINDKGLEPTVMIDNVQDEIDKESNKMLPEGNDLNWKTYGTLDDLYKFLDQKSESFDFVNVKNLEDKDGYPLKVLAIEKPDAERRNKKTSIWIDGGMYGREWLSPAVVTFAINELLLNTTEVVANIINDFNLFILPVMNPMGYSYSHETDRLWKKTRSPTQSPVGCRGADIDRNWNYEFDKNINQEACSDFYNGGSSSSLYEVKLLSEFFNGRPNEFGMFLTLHGYNEMVLFPYGYSTEEHELYKKLEAWGHNAANAMNINSRSFESGNIVKMLSERPGCSVDWVFKEKQIDIVLAIELGNANKGFINLQDQIILTGQEFMKGLIRLAEILRKLGESTKPFGNYKGSKHEL